MQIKTYSQTFFFGDVYNFSMLLKKEHLNWVKNKFNRVFVCFSKKCFYFINNKF